MVAVDVSAAQFPYPGRGNLFGPFRLVNREKSYQGGSNGRQRQINDHPLQPLAVMEMMNECEIKNESRNPVQDFIQRGAGWFGEKSPDEQVADKAAGGGECQAIWKESTSRLEPFDNYKQRQNNCGKLESEPANRCDSARVENQPRKGQCRYQFPEMC